jgi:hypothetical protein
MRQMMVSGMAAVLLLTGWSRTAQAQFSYEWHRDGQPVSGTIEVPASSSFTLEVYVREQAGGTVLQTERLVAAGVRAHYGSTPGVIQVPDTAAISRNPQFTDYELLAVNNPDYAQFSAAVRVTEPGVPPDANNRILLGSLTFQVLGGVGSSTLLRAEDIPNDNTTLTSTGFELDTILAQNPPTLMVSVVPVPEPTTLLAVSSLGFSIAHLARRHRRRRQPTGTE